MSQTILVSVLLANFGCVFLLAIAMQLDLSGLYVFLESKNYHQTEIEHIESLKMLGQMIFGMISAQIITLANLKKIALIFLITLLLNKFNIIFLENYNLVKIHFIIAAGCNLGLMMICLMQLIEFAPNLQNFIVTTYLLLIVFAKIIGQFIFTYIINLGPLNLKLLDILIYILILMIIISVEIPKRINGLFKINLTNLIKYVELELISAFTLSYVTMAIYWEYEVFAIAEDLKINNIYQVINYILISVVLVAVPLQFIINNLNRHIANLISLFAILLSIFGLKYLGNHYNLNLLALSMTGVCLGLIFIDNLKTLAEKFEGENLKITVSFYFGFLGTGSYLGMIVTEQTMNKLEEWGFIYSICFVLGSFLLYYLAQISRAKSKI